jgi:hypothetical protein
MTEKLTAGDLYTITHADLRAAISTYANRSRTHAFADSTQFDLLGEDGKRYPPKAIVGLAAQRSVGRILSPADFSGGESSSAFRLLRHHGFEIVTKPRMVGALDATFSIGTHASGIFLLFESRGPQRNTEYAEGLEAALYSLADVDATLTSISVASSDSRRLPVAQRQLLLPHTPCPFPLRSVFDIPALRREIGSCAAAVGRAAETGGNSTKKLRIEFSLPQPADIRRIAEAIADDDGTALGPVRHFQFAASAPTGSVDISVRRALPETRMGRVHVAMQRQLYCTLVAEHGQSNVAAELIMPSGRPADLVVKHSGALDIYELKTAGTAKDCIRQALGQFLSTRTGLARTRSGRSGSSGLQRLTPEARHSWRPSERASLCRSDIDSKFLRERLSPQLLATRFLVATHELTRSRSGRVGTNRAA